MSAPTNGPWTLGEWDRNIFVYGGPNNDDIAEFNFADEHTVTITREEALANARLFLKARTLSEWHAIETAPKDGTHFLAGCFDGSIGFGYFGGQQVPMQTVVHYYQEPGVAPDNGDSGFYVSVFGGDEAVPMKWTHWKPLDEPPARETQEASEVSRETRRETSGAPRTEDDTKSSRASDGGER